MRPATVIDLAHRHGIHLPDALTSGQPPELRATDEKGWFRFQRLYDIARSCVRTEDDVRRLVLEAAQDDARDGSRWLEIQVDPTSYAVHLGGLTPTLELVLDAVQGGERARPASASRWSSRPAGSGTRWTPARWPGWPSSTPATGSARWSASGSATTSAAGRTEDFAGAFRIARNAGLASVPHSGELLGPDHVQVTLDALAPDRIGHGVRSVEDPRVLEQVVRARDHPGGVPRLERRARRLPRGRGGAAADPAGRRCPGRARRGRPAAVRHPAHRPVPDRPRGARPGRRRAGRRWPRPRSAARGRRTT